MLYRRFGRIGRVVMALAVLGLLVTGCVPLPGEGGGETARLRVTNGGEVLIEDLTVLFPDQEIVFGDVAPGETTEYVAAPGGVYNYAAYRYTLEGETVTQPVIDWMGEEPIGAGDFTYTISFDPTRTQMQHIELIGVDEEN